ncbi:hypothetical protein H5410_048560 [Solanum commersonii]|uniref:Fe2OG dioxygenase domain-containing protein n=1 Tax=Solanum commersonii TaxID=4109 RepID=A0A9J5XM34_SOLCO|nr:hypothetical protein H5410_048560 [Solanum commersonii]
MDYDPSDEKKAIDDAKAGVKGLVDSGVVEIPRIFIRPPHELAEELNMCKSTQQVPVVDLCGIHVEDGRMIDGTRKFHEQDVEVKKEYYSSDPTARQVRYESNLLQYKTKGLTSNWKDTLYISELIFGHIEPEEIPQVCRKTSAEYINHVVKLEDILLGLLSEALRLKTNHLKATECDKRQLMNGGLQVMCDNQWANVTPIEHGLVANISDLLQILSNDKFVSAIHRVVERNVGPRISVACFFSGVSTPPKTYGPIKELIAEENPPLYKEFQTVNRDRVRICDSLDNNLNLAKDYDPSDEKKAIDDTKAGVKGLVDSGIVEIPRIFIRPPHELAEELNMCKSTLQVPVVDLSGIEVEDRLINHGVPSSVLEGMIDGTRKFHEQDVEVKKEYYSSDPTTRRVRYDGNVHVYKTKGKTAHLKDTLYVAGLVSGHIEPEELPEVCRETMKEYVEYTNHVNKLGEILFGMLSEGLGLKPDQLKVTECAKEQGMACHYYPTSPQPELTLGTGKHTDPAFLTFILQNQIGGLQVMCDNQWADVEPIEHGLVVIIGDLLQILSNDKFVSATHRVVANKAAEPRISVIFFFSGVSTPPKMFGPIKELISEENPPLYKQVLIVDYVSIFCPSHLIRLVLILSDSEVK